MVKIDILVSMKKLIMVQKVKGVQFGLEQFHNSNSSFSELNNTGVPKRKWRFVVPNGADQ